MSKVFARGAAALAVLLLLVGCEAAKSANPTAPSVAGPIPGVNITAPHALEPYPGQSLTYTGDAPTLLIENAGTSGVRTITLDIDVATDTSFTQIVHHAEGVELGENGRTTYRLPSALPAGYTYYWRMMARDGANSGPYSDAVSFNVVPPVVIDAPVATSPSGNINNNNPDFRVTNGAISGTSGVGYRFEVAKDAGFTQMVAIVTVPVNGTGTTFMSLGSLPYDSTFFWRVRGSDGNAESDYSNTLAFKTSSPPAPVTGPDPTLAGDSSGWSDAQWEDFVMNLLRSTGPTVNDAAMHSVRGELLARGVDYQNGWRGDIRPRIFLPVPGCPIANRPGVPLCSYNKTVDLGSYGGPWQWIPRY
jgi:hypothetical protein